VWSAARVIMTAQDLIAALKSFRGIGRSAAAIAGTGGPRSSPEIRTNRQRLASRTCSAAVDRYWRCSWKKRVELMAPARLLIRRETDSGAARMLLASPCQTLKGQRHRMAARHSTGRPAREKLKPRCRCRVCQWRRCKRGLMALLDDHGRAWPAHGPGGLQIEQPPWPVVVAPTPGLHSGSASTAPRQTLAR